MSILPNSAIFPPISFWRKRWDSNPRTACTVAGFQDRFLKPLGHSSIPIRRQRLMASLWAKPPPDSRSGQPTVFIPHSTRRGKEPPVAFKTVALNHSATRPGRRLSRPEVQAKRQDGRNDGLTQTRAYATSG